MSESQGRANHWPNFDGRNTLFLNDANALDDRGGPKFCAESWHTATPTSRAMRADLRQVRDTGIVTRVMMKTYQGKGSGARE